MTEPFDWRGYTRAAGLEMDGDSIVVRFQERGRHQRVGVVEVEDGLVVRSIAARGKAWREAELDPMLLRQRNRSLDLVGLHVDDRDRLVAQAWLPALGITPEEFAVYVRTVAAEADRLEFWLTGADVE